MTFGYAVSSYLELRSSELLELYDDCRHKTRACGVIYYVVSRGNETLIFKTRRLQPVGC